MGALYGTVSGLVAVISRTSLDFSLLRHGMPWQWCSDYDSEPGSIPQTTEHPACLTQSIIPTVKLIVVDENLRR